MELITHSIHGGKQAEKRGKGEGTSAKRRESNNLVRDGSPSVRVKGGGKS